MPITQYRSRTFDRKPFFHDNRLRRLEDYITPTMRNRAASIDEQIWDFDLSKVLDQGNTGHCIGFAWAGNGICTPVNDAWTNADGDRIYYESVAIGGEPNSEDGSTTLWGAKAMQKNEGRIDSYAFASNVDDLIVWLKTNGPSVNGTDWLSGMMDADANGQVHATGSFVGGHDWLIRGVDTVANVFHAIQSWGKSWAKGGAFTIAITDFITLFNSGGDSCLAVELPIGTPVPTPTPTPAPSGNGCLTLLAKLIRQYAADPNVATYKRIVRATLLMANDLSKKN
jgi:hypothetical protein